MFTRPGKITPRFSAWGVAKTARIRSPAPPAAQPRANRQQYSDWGQLGNPETWWTAMENFSGVSVHVYIYRYRLVIIMSIIMLMIKKIMITMILTTMTMIIMLIIMIPIIIC